MTVFNGDLVNSDLINPTILGRFRDDSLLTGVSPDRVVPVNLDSPSGTNNFDDYLQIINADTGAVIAFNDDDPGVNSQLSFTVQQEVNYIVRATSFDSAPTDSYIVTTNLANVIPSIPITGNETINGSLTNTDPSNPTRNGRFSDDYLLTGIAVGDLIQIDLNSPSGTSNFDTYLQLINADTETVIAFNDDSNRSLNSKLIFKAKQGVNYIVRATSFRSGATGNYTLSTSTIFSIDGTLANTDLINPARTGRFSDDYFLTDITAGQAVQINLDSPSGTSNFDSYLQLVNADTGTVIAFNDDGGLGLNSQLNFTAEQGVNYIVRATSFSSGATGNYNLTSTVSILSEAAPISLNQTISGTLDTTDLNNDLRNGRLYDGYYLSDLVTGTPVQINLNSPSGTSNFNTYLQLVNVNTGAVIAFNDDGGPGVNSQLNFTPEQGINYIVRATSFDSGATGDYTLTIGNSNRSPTQGFNIDINFDANWINSQTEFLNNGINPINTGTIDSLADMGDRVNFGTADPYITPLQRVNALEYPSGNSTSSSLLQLGEMIDVESYVIV